ncbi:MAG: chemotaxis protein CheA [Bacteroidota bacterium]
MSQMDNETREMIMQFVSESLDSLDTNEPLVENLRLEDNSEYVNSIFRVFHTLKGLSGFFEMFVINRVTHEAETLLDIMRKQNKAQSEDIISIIYSVFDFLRELLNRVSENLTDKDAEAEAEDMIIIIRDAINRVQNPELSEEDFFFAEDTDTTSSEENAQPPSISGGNEEMMCEAQDVTQSDDGLESLVSNELMDQYLSSAYELIDTAENNLLILENDPNNFDLIANTFRVIHSLKGNSGFMGLSEIEEISMEMESILDSIRNKDLQIDTTIVNILLSNIETIRNRLSALSPEGSKSKAFQETIAETNAATQTNLQIEDAHSESDINQAEGIELAEEEITVDANIHKETLPQTPKSEPKKEEAKPVKQVAAKQEDVNANKTTPPASMAKKDIRVETSKIDKLFDLVGELITIETMVTNSPDLQGLELPNFLKSANMLNKITRELQEVAMSVRMMPLENLFNKMKRLVRDVSLKMNKKVNLEISGQETEMDKNVIDEVADPLVHILRNAIDHGIEPPEVRIKKGKPEVGSISLKARYEGNEILIIVKDDGAGINRDKILKKAEDRGIISGNTDKMTDKEVFQLIFEPGFSTAEQVTDISGRGVGMDVVRKNIEKLHGSVDIESKEGFGSTFTLRIPLTLAIMDAMLIRVGQSRYALPLLAVTESFRVNRHMISKTMDGLEVCKLRDDVLPVIRLHELFNIVPDSYDLEKGIMIIIESREKQVALFADEIIGQQQAVIKGLSDYIGKVSGITGCMILGDGGIGLIIDIESLIELSEKAVFVG